MPSILLINDNKIVSRLLQLSSEKQNYTLEEINDYTAGKDAYNVIFIDSEKYDPDAWEALKSTLTYDKLGFIGDKTHPKPEGFDLVLEKPFLPTDFVALMQENFRVMSEDEMADELDEIEDIGDEEALDLDSLEEMEIDESLDSLEEESVGLDLDSFEDESPISDTTLTTGITDTLAEDDSNQEEIANLMDEIDGMEEEPLEEMDLDALGDEEIVEESTSESDILDEEMVKESLEEVEGELQLEDEDVLDEKEMQALEDVTGSKMGLKEDALTEEDSALLDAAVGVAAASTIVDDGQKENSILDEETDEKLNILDGVEKIENEEDYLIENSPNVEALADEFDSLNEDEVAKLMAGESDTVSQEVVNEVIEQEEVEPVAANDLEDIVARAVSKAITKEMLQEALNGMEITVSLKTKRDKEG